VDLAEFKVAVDGWLDEHESELTPSFDGIGTLDQQMTQLRKVMQLTYDAGFMRMGWPERVGGLGGSNLLRAYLGEVLTARDLVEPGIYSMPEVLAPTMIDYAPPELAATMVPRLLRGEEIWCQGFSEPGTGSNLASLACRATRTDAGWSINGQKVWTSLAQYAQRCVLLTRTGTVESAHRGLTALFVDMDSAGIIVRPIETMHGAQEFCEVFFDDVVVPPDRVLGQVDQGWSIAMDLLPYERSTALWHRAAYLQRRLEQLVTAAPPGALDPTAVGQATELLWAFRARSRATQRRLAARETLGAETSVDKVLVAAAEQAVFDLVGDGLGVEVALGDDPVSQRWRAEFLYSRAATIYGGSAEIQRNIIARRLLDLGADR
jgi:alkylation response protein AidB-like acyl-CoA dehydrogenase